MQSVNDSQWERALEQVARKFEYPPTPAIAASVRERMATADGRRPIAAPPPLGGRPSAVVPRLSWALLLFAIAALALLAVPQTRAAVLSFFARIGAIDIFVDDAPEPATPAPAPTALPTGTGTTGALPAALPTPTALAHALSLIDLGEPVTLAEAARRVRFTPQLPAALGEPEAIYLHPAADLPAMTLVWNDEAGTPLSLTAIGVREFAHKFISEQQIEATTVNGDEAYWLRGPHTLQLLGSWQPGRLTIASNVLIWVQDGLTYRLEGDLSLEDALAVAESVGN